MLLPLPFNSNTPFSTNSFISILAPSSESPVISRYSLFVIFPFSFTYVTALICRSFSPRLRKYSAVLEGLMTIKAVFAGIIHFLMSLFSYSGSMDNLSGPICIAVTAGTALNAGATSLLYFTGFLSLSLGILNLLPLPALDGGHFAILVIETLKRRPLSQRTYQIVGLAGISFFLILIFIVSYMDIVKLCLESSLSYINRYCGTVRICYV